MENDQRNLGKCCICEIEGATVRNLITLHVKTPDGELKGGWGCFVCGLEARGAVAVLCDACIEAWTGKRASIKFACLGYPGANRRIEIEKLTETYEHVTEKHPENWNWEKAWSHFESVRRIYRDYVTDPNANTSPALYYIFRPLSERYRRGERTAELFKAMMSVG